LTYPFWRKLFNKDMPPQGITNDEDNQMKLPGDSTTPFSPPSGVQDTTDDTHPEADTNVDAHEHYDEGISGASETIDKGDRGILGYEPKKSEDKT
jgi:hypothetical protein